MNDMPGPALGLERITRLLAALGNPHLKVPIVHVAGTNGKGSICAYLDSIFQHARLRTGRFNSPHLIEPNDSVLFDGQPVAPSLFRFVSQHVDSVGLPLDASPFERLTATAFSLFAQAKPALDVAVIEVGLGGALDATNVCPHPLATVLGPVDLDHQALLGNTVEEIARVKAGIFKKGSIAVVSAQQHASVVEVARQVAHEVGSALHLASEGEWQSSGELKLDIEPSLESNQPLLVRPSLPGRYQSVNASAAALTSALLSRQKMLAITNDDIRSGLEQTSWPGRLSSLALPGLSSPALVDGAHNPSSALHLRQYLDTQNDRRPVVFIVGLSAPREPSAILEPLLNGFGDARLVATRFSTPVEGMPWVKPVEPAQVAEAGKALGVQSDQADTLADALALVEKDDRVVICGSLYLVADAHRLSRA